MSESTTKEESKSSLKNASLNLKSKNFVPQGKKSEPFKPADLTKVSTQDSVKTSQTGFNVPSTSYSMAGGFSYGASGMIPPISGIANFIPQVSGTPFQPPPPPPVQTPAQMSAPAALSTSSLAKSSLTKTSRSFMPKTIKSGTVSADASDAKQATDGSKHTLKLTNKLFTPKTASVTEVAEETSNKAEETPAPISEPVQEAKDNEVVQEAPKEIEVVEEPKVEPKVEPQPETQPETPEVKPEESVPEVIPVVEVVQESYSKYPEPLRTLIASYKANGKLTVNELKSLKDCDICQCKQMPSIYINTNLLNRKSEKQTIYSKSYQKGGRGKHQNYKGNNNFAKNTVKKKSTYGGNRNETGGFERQQVSEDVKKLKVQASQIRERLDKHDSSDIEKQTKALFNKITPDNMKRLKEQIRDVLMNCQTEEDRFKFIKVMFKKATHEDKYCSMYTNLITYLGECETNALNKGQEGPHEGSPSKSKSKMRKAKESKLKKEIVIECKAMFEEFSSEMKIDQVPEADREEFEYKYKKQLYGNLKFIAELYKKRLVSKAVCLYVLAYLLGKVHMAANEFTIEGACTFLCKVGEKLERQVLKAQEEDDEDVPTHKKSKEKEDMTKLNQKNAYLNIIEILTNYQQDQNISSRIRIIIQNTMHKRDNNWVENIQEEGPKTKKQIREDHLRALQGFDDTSQKKSPKAKKQQSDKNYDFSQIELTKMASSTSAASEYDDEVEMREEHVPKEYSEREIEHMSHEAIKDRFIGNFVEWLGNGVINVEMFKKDENKTSGDKIIEFMLDKLYDKPEGEVTKFNEYIFLIFKEGLFQIKDIEKAISSFFVTIPNIESDFPHLPVFFSELLYYLFVEKNIADFAKVKIDLVGDNEGLEEDEEPIYLIDIYFKILGLFLTKIYNNYQDQFDNYYTSYNIDEIARRLRPYITDDDLFKEIQSMYNVPENIIKLLDVQVD